uniref:Tripartite motif containing 39 n=1 Tax=Pelodiscus sinensis TaxID=13735 RepID=K7F219_PELSI
MAAGDLARSFQDEATCPICLEFFTDPVSIECGHNYCWACLSQCWGESEPKFSCPQCRETILQRHLRPNYQLGNLVELVKRLQLPAGPVPKGQPGCKRHQESLNLFCQEDQAPICVVCDRSREHRAHTVVPIEEAAQEYKEKLQGALGPLREQLEEALVLRSEEEEKTAEWQLSPFPSSAPRHEYERLIPRWGIAPASAPGVHTEHQFSFSFQDVKSTLSRWEPCSDAEQLLMLGRLLPRSENMKLQEPEAVCTDLQRKYKICLDLRETLNRFAVSLSPAPSPTPSLHLVPRCQPDLSVPDLCAPDDCLSEDRKCVRLRDTHQDLLDIPKRFDYCVFVLPPLGRGRSHSHLRMDTGSFWTLGVCRESVSRKGKVTLTPKNGYWVMWLRDGGYKACTSSPTPLPVSTKRSRVGIFLDYEAGEALFYNVTDRSHLFTFTDTFSGTLCPFFSPYLNIRGTNTAPLTICPV